MAIISLKFGTSPVTLHYRKTHLGRMYRFLLVLREAEFLATSLQRRKFLFCIWFYCRCASHVYRYSYLSKFIINILLIK